MSEVSVLAGMRDLAAAFAAVHEKRAAAKINRWADRMERLEARVKELEANDAGLNIAMKAAAETVNLVMNLDPHWHPPQGDTL